MLRITRLKETKLKAPEQRRFRISFRVLNSPGETGFSLAKKHDRFCSQQPALVFARIFRTRSTTMADVTCFMQA